jgi:RNA polymerase sigma factor (TIGR02999 family)
MGEFTQALADLRSGRATTDAVNALFRATYQELEQLAHSRLRQNFPVTALDTGAVVHESYLRFLGSANIELHDRRHFLAYAGKVMRSVIVDMARRKLAARRDGGIRVTLPTDIDVHDTRTEEVTRVDDALEQLEIVDPMLVRVVEMRYFAGLTVEEVAGELDTSVRTVARQWQKARLLLLDALSD